MIPPARVWVTRAEPGAAATAGRLRDLGLDPLTDPVLEVRPLEASIDLAGVDALAFTSANAVRAFADRWAERAHPVFAVGEASAAAARLAGFRQVDTADGDVQALARRIAEARPGLVLNPAAAEPAADLVALLAERGVEARSVALYETVDRDPATALARLGEINWVLVHSPKAGRRLARLLDPKVLAKLRFVGISEAAGRALAEAGAQNLCFATFPDEAAMLKLIVPA